MTRSLAQLSAERQSSYSIRGPPLGQKRRRNSNDYNPLPKQVKEGNYTMRLKRPLTLTAALGVAPLLMSPIAAQAATVANPLCPVETAIFAPDQGQDIIVPGGFKVSVFASGLNAPTGIAFAGNKNNFQVYVLESGHGIPSRCNEQDSIPGGTFTPNNPFTPDILVFNQNGGTPIRKLAKPTAPGVGLQPAGPAIDIAFERGFQGGRLFATDSNQATHTGTAANS